MDRNAFSLKTLFKKACAHEAYTIGLTVCLSLWIIASAPVAKADNFLSLPNYDLPGNDLRSPSQDPGLKQLTESQCRDVCLSETKCKAYTYNKAVGWCFLKASMSPPVAFSGAVSGVRATQQTTRSAAFKSIAEAAQKPSNADARSEVEHKTAISAMPAQRAPLAEGPKPTPIPVAKNSINNKSTAPAAVSDSRQALIMAEKPKTNATVNVVIPEPPGKQANTTSVARSLPTPPTEQYQTASGPSSEATKSVSKKNPWRFSSMEAVLAENQTPGAIPKPVTHWPSQTEAAKPIVTNTGALGSSTTPVPQAPKQTAHLTPAVPQQVKKALIDTNKDAGYLRRIMSKHQKLQKKLQALSGKYLKKYDDETPGTKWVKVESLGMDVPMSMTRKQAQAIVLSNMRKDETLIKLQKQILSIDKQIHKPYQRLKNALPSAASSKLHTAYTNKQNASKAFAKIKASLSAYGDRLAEEARQTWQMPSDEVLRKLHRLARKMRRKRLQTLEANTVFAQELKKAIETPILVSSF